MKSLGDEVRRLQDSLGILGTNVRQIPRWKARKLMPSKYLRPNSFKQVLRPEEEEKLELVGFLNTYRFCVAICLIPHTDDIIFRVKCSNEWQVVISLQMDVKYSAGNSPKSEIVHLASVSLGLVICFDALII